MKLDFFANSLQQDDRINFYSKLLSQVPDLIFQMTISAEGRINFPFLSESVINHFELTDEEIGHYTIDVLKSKIVPEDFDRFMDAVAHAKTHMQHLLFEFRCNLPVKGIRWFRARATVEKDCKGGFVFYGRVNDSTDNRIQALKLKISEERYQFALEASSEGIWDFDVRTNKVFFSSQSMKMLHFAEKDAILDIDVWDERIHPDDIQNYKKDIQRHLEDRTPYYENLQRVRTRNDEYKWVLSRGKIIDRDLDGNPLRVIGTHSDVTSRIERENELQKTLEILSEQNKKLLNFAHIVSHNLRSHAGNFKMLLDFIEFDDDEELRKESLLHLRTNSNDLTETIDNLKELVEIQSDLKPVKEHLNLREYLGKMLNLLMEEFERHHVEFKIDIPDHETVYFNPAYLESVLLNFSTNAVKYSQPNKRPLIHYNFFYHDGVKVLSIADNGLGIDLAKHGSSLFGMYKTFHRHPNSRGLGLFMSKNQVEAMGGKITVDSEVNSGTIFKIYFNE
ncbi:MAG: histidine kinase [Flavobacterium sp. BFFFF1]|uniref:sensor histidine kinase n=1 Tax=unclassified Flavobacterium TaxID=196869 RepID=UPI000BDC4A41|nr:MULTISPECIES: PAS domain-containing sensor histidine kinase [unclassified Flavobacterium]OYU81992.1 MAG: histidine kinase [Flavobacterium sp. BFFFF1]